MRGSKEQVDKEDRSDRKTADTDARGVKRSRRESEKEAAANVRREGAHGGQELKARKGSSSSRAVQILVGAVSLGQVVAQEKCEMSMRNRGWHGFFCVV